MKRKAHLWDILLTVSIVRGNLWKKSLSKFQIGAKFTSAGIAPDEFNQPNLNLSYDGKRDRWNGYDPEQHKAILEEYQKVEEAKRELRAKKLEQGKFLFIIYNNMIVLWCS